MLFVFSSGANAQIILDPPDALGAVAVYGYRYGVLYSIYDYDNRTLTGFIYKKAGYIYAGDHAVDDLGRNDIGNDRYAPFEDDSLTPHKIFPLHPKSMYVYINLIPLIPQSYKTGEVCTTMFK